MDKLYPVVYLIPHSVKACTCSPAFIVRVFCILNILVTFAVYVIKITNKLLIKFPRTELEWNEHMQGDLENLFSQHEEKSC